MALIAAAAIAVLWRSRAAYEIKAAALGAGAMLATPYLYTYDLVVLAVPLAFLFSLGRKRGFLPHEMTGIGIACLLILIFPFVKAPVGFAAVLVVDGADRAARNRPSERCRMSGQANTLSAHSRASRNPANESGRARLVALLGLMLTLGLSRPARRRLSRRQFPRRQTRPADRQRLRQRLGGGQAHRSTVIRPPLTTGRSTRPPRSAPSATPSRTITAGTIRRHFCLSPRRWRCCRIWLR